MAAWSLHIYCSRSIQCGVYRTVTGPGQGKRERLLAHAVTGYLQDLRTNIKGRYRFGSYSDTSLGKEGVVVGKGDHIGLFKLGSSVVLLFEGPKDFKFLVKPGQRVRYGQPMGQTT